MPSCSLIAICMLAIAPSAYAEPLAAPSAAPHPFAHAAPIDTAALERHRGGDQQVNENRLRANLGDNSASNLATGMNAISEGSFGQASGFPMVIQNSGNNVIIQNSTILNLTVK